MTSLSDLLPSYLTIHGKNPEILLSTEILRIAPGLGNLKEIQEVHKKSEQQLEAGGFHIYKSIPFLPSQRSRTTYY